MQLIPDQAFETPAGGPNQKLEAYKAKLIERCATDGYDEFRGGVLSDIGKNAHVNPNPRNGTLGEEIILTKKRQFVNTQTCLSNGFESLAIPGSKDALLVQYRQILQLEKNKKVKEDIKKKS